MMKGHLGVRPGKHGESHFYKLYDGLDPETGKKKYVGNGGYPTKKAAEADMNLHLAKIMQERAVAYIQSIIPGFQGIMPSAAPDPVEKITLEAYLRKWVTEYVPLKDVEETTINSYHDTIEKDLIPNLGHIYLHDLRKADIREWVEKMQKPGYSKRVRKLAPRTIHRKFSCLSVALHDAAEEWELISVNPATGVRLPKAATGKKKNPISPEQAQIILDAMLGTWAYVPTYLGFRTGARVGELMALRRDCIDLVAGTLEIKKGMKQIIGQGVVEGRTKTKSSVRVIKLDTDTIDVLTNHIFQQRADYALQGKKWLRNEYLFPSSINKGKPYVPQSLSSKFTKVARSLGFGDISFHDTRHAHASIMYSACHDLVVIQKRLGHSNLTTTANTYLHLLKGVDDKAVIEFERVMNGEPITDAVA